MFNSGPGCHKWVLIVAQRKSTIHVVRHDYLNNFNTGDANDGQEFCKNLEKACIGMGFPMKAPKAMVIKENRTAAYVEAVNKAADLSPQMIMVIIPNNKGDTYHAIKKILCVNRPIPSQVITIIFNFCSL